MHALVASRYGTHEVLEYREIPQPVPRAREVLVRVHTVSLNASDKEYLTGKPVYTRFTAPCKPGKPVLGTDVTGIVAAVGSKVRGFRVGDAVMGDLLFGGTGGLAEYACGPEASFHPKPASLDFAAAATLLQAAEVAYQGIVDKGRVSAGTRLLINGAGGAAGSFAIPLAKHLGAEVSVVDSAAKGAFMRALGADRVIDYACTDYTAERGRYDVILDLVASRPLFANRRALARHGRYLLVGGPFRRILNTFFTGSLLSLPGARQSRMVVITPGKRLAELVALVEAGVLTPAIGHRLAFAEAREGFRLLIAGEALGKIVVTMGQDGA
jgi:NADPH:quinone reductase-like Zn-dependent oxidoreductase